MPSTFSAACRTAGLDQITWVVLVLGLGLNLSGCGPSANSSNEEKFRQLAEQPILYQELERNVTIDVQPIRALKPIDVATTVANPSTLAKIQLGKLLFHDTRLSADETLSCASCHDLQNGGDDGRTVSLGVLGRKGRVNAPTVLNSSLNTLQFWDGRARTLAEQALIPVLDRDEMAGDLAQIVAKLSADETVSLLQRKAYGSGKLTASQMADSIAFFERALLTPSPFDRYLQGERQAISADAAEGYAIFKQYGCASCHQGVNIGGNLKQYFGAFQSIDEEERRVNSEARANASGTSATRSDSDAHKFKVPSLRNVALTAPYFHMGNVQTLRQAVRVMAAAQLARVLNTREIDLLVAFLESLTGKVPTHLLPDLNRSIQ